MYQSIRFAIVAALLGAKAFAGPIFEKPMELSAYLGYSQFTSPNPQRLVISDYLTDTLTKPQQQHYPTLRFAAKKILPIEQPLLQKIAIGPSIYLQEQSHSGAVFELMSPEFYNYHYAFSTKNASGLIDLDYYLKPLSNGIQAFLNAGLGLGLAAVRYDDYALPGIDPAGERHRGIYSLHAVYALGAGLALPLNSKWVLQLRYSYLHMGKAAINPYVLAPIRISLNSNNLFLGLHYAIT